MDVKSLNSLFIRTTPIFTSATATTSNLTKLSEVLTINKSFLDNQVLKLCLRASAYVGGVYEDTLLYLSCKFDDTTYNNVAVQEKECENFKFYYKFENNTFTLYLKQNVTYCSTKVFLVEGSLSNININLNSVFNIDIGTNTEASIHTKKNYLPELSNSWVYDTVEDNYVVKEGNLVTLNMLISGGSLITDETTQLILTLPEGLRPQNAISIYPIYKNSNTYVVTRGRIYKEGILKIFSVASNEQLHITATFRI